MLPMQFIDFYWILLRLFSILQGSLAIQGGSAPYQGIREHHKHPLESLDFPFAPGANGDGSEQLLESIESYQDITNETVLYLPLVRRFVQEKFGGGGNNDSDSRFRVKYAGWRFSPTKKEVLIQLKHFDRASNNDKGMNCAVLLNFVKDNVYLFKKSTCIPSSEAKCFALRKGLSKIQINIFNPQRPHLSEIEEIDCYGTRSCISEFSTSNGFRTFYKLGCFQKGINRRLPTSSFSGSSNCLHRSMLLENNLHKTECSGALCNDPYYSEMAESRLLPVIEHLNQMLQRIERKLEDIEARITNLS